MLPFSEARATVRVEVNLSTFGTPGKILDAFHHFSPKQQQTLNLFFKQLIN